MINAHVNAHGLGGAHHLTSYDGNFFLAVTIERIK